MIFVEGKILYNPSTINNIYLFVLLFNGSLMYIISQYFSIDRLMGYLFLFLAFIVVFFGKVKLNVYVSIFYLLLVSVVLLNILFRYNQQQEIYLYNLLTFGAFGIMSAFCEFDIKKIFKWGTIYGVIWILINFIDNFSYGLENPFAFGFITLPIIYFTFSYMQLNKNNKQIYYAIFFFLICLLIIIVQYSGRGALINIFLFVILKLISSRKKTYLLTGISLMTIIPVLYINIERILIAINNIPFIKLDAVDKTLYLIENDNITNGRIELYKLALNSLNGMDWLTGLGFGQFGYSEGGIYVHNLFLNILVDFGLIGVIVLLLMILKYFILLLRCEDINMQNYMIVIFVLSIGVLSFSMDYTTSIPLFIFFGIMAKGRIKYPKKYSGWRIRY